MIIFPPFTLFTSEIHSNKTRINQMLCKFSTVCVTVFVTFCTLDIKHGKGKIIKFGMFVLSLKISCN